MSLLKDIFGKKDEPIQSYQDFWSWFQKHEKAFFNSVKKQTNIEKDFFDKIDPKLQEIKDGFFYLTGMYDNDTVELVLTADGNVKNIAFVEELVAAAPQIKGWKFTALKPPLEIDHVNIAMEGYEFNAKNLFFYSEEHTDFPDEIDIRVVHTDYRKDNKKTITNGSFIFLENYLGELNFVTSIDHIAIMGKPDPKQELIPISKLQDFLIWRQKEFIEKYEGTLQNTENDNYSGLEAELENGNPLIAIINTDILNWENKASHPWVLIVEIEYDGENHFGMPDQETYQLLEEIENEILEELKDEEGYLKIGRQTADNVREIYFACKDFRKPSKVLHQIMLSFAPRLEIDYDIYKDKYWQSFDRFKPDSDYL
ncbi:MAG: DUF695 domain-containing protein [Microscillaceae bacterium]|nr:DUF695 domain-containing protein [Microscillaceae bacterium]